MAFRGGRGRGRGGFSFAFKATPQPFTLFPEDVQLPDAKKVPTDTDYFKWSKKLKDFFKNSAYVIEESNTPDCQNYDIERYSDSSKQRNKMKRDSLSDILMLKPGYFPQELIKGVKTSSSSKKKVKWDPAADKRLFELLEKKEKEKGEKEPEEEEEEEVVSEDDQEISDEGDYEQNQVFDDDEDEYNDIDDGEDEAFY